MSTVKYWLHIAVWAVICLWQEVRGEEPDCPECWKCESMRLLVLCVGAFTITKVLLWLM